MKTELLPLLLGEGVNESFVSSRPPYAARGGNVFVIDRLQLEDPKDASYASYGSWVNQSSVTLGDRAIRERLEGKRIRCKYWIHPTSLNHKEYCRLVSRKPDDCQGKCYEHREGDPRPPLEPELQFRRRLYELVDADGNACGRYAVQQYLGDETLIAERAHGNRVHNQSVHFEKTLESTRVKIRERVEAGQAPNQIRRQLQAHAKHPGEAPRGYKQAENAKGNVAAKQKGGGRSRDELHNLITQVMAREKADERSGRAGSRFVREIIFNGDDLIVVLALDW